jgi:hypothetical protein
MIHESMHAGNPDVGDAGTYVEDPGFTEVSELEKLKNAAHFEIAPRRALIAADSFPGKVFIPRDTSHGGGSAPTPTATQLTRVSALKTFERAWHAADNLHAILVGLYDFPTMWDTDDLGHGRKLKTCLPFWSKVENLTIHKKTVIDPASSNPAKHPVSQIDVALSEGVVRSLSLAMHQLPKTDSLCAAFEDESSTAAERAAAHASPVAYAKFLVSLMLNLPNIGPITGSHARDLRVVDLLSTVDLHTLLDTRTPNAFPD